MRKLRLNGMQIEWLVQIHKFIHPLLSPKRNRMMISQLIKTLLKTEKSTWQTPAMIICTVANLRGQWSLPPQLILLSPAMVRSLVQSKPWKQHPHPPQWKRTPPRVKRHYWSGCGTEGGISTHCVLLQHPCPGSLGISAVLPYWWYLSLALCVGVWCVWCVWRLMVVLVHLWIGRRVSYEVEIEGIFAVVLTFSMEALFLTSNYF